MKYRDCPCLFLNPVHLRLATSRVNPVQFPFDRINGILMIDDYLSIFPFLILLIL
jgi:hypothetical protein